MQVAVCRASHREINNVKPGMRKKPRKKLELRFTDLVVNRGCSLNNEPDILLRVRDLKDIRKRNGRAFGRLEIHKVWWHRSSGMHAI